MISLSDYKKAYKKRQKEIEHLAHKLYSFLIRKKLTLGEVMYLLEYMKYLNKVNLDETRKNIENKKDEAEKEEDDSVRRMYV